MGKIKKVVSVLAVIGISVLTGIGGGVKASERSIQTWQFDYTGNIQEFTVPQTGLYQLDVYGASSRSEFNARGGLGGHSSGKIQLEAGDKLYIAVGGIGTAWTKTGNSDIGPDIFNGGGNAYSYGGPSRATAGGGATHIALGGGGNYLNSPMREQRY